MNKFNTSKKCIESFNNRGAALFLALLLCGDLIFFLLHFINAFLPILDNPLFNLKMDMGYPEIYQCIKFFWIVIIFISLSIKNASLHYVSWALVFAYFLLDDFLLIHERLGYRISSNLGIEPSFGFRLQDYGEFVVTSVAGIILLTIILWAYINGSRVLRKISQDLVFLILILIFFGVFVDMVNPAISLSLGRKVHFVLVVIEECGEMISVSFIVWYVFVLMVRKCDSECYLVDCLRIFITNNYKILLK